MPEITIQAEYRENDDVPVYQYSCSHCNETAFTKSKIRSHILNTHTDEIKNEPGQDEIDFTCEECGATFNCKKDLTEHQNEHIKDTVYSSSYCEGTSTNKREVARQIISANAQPISELISSISALPECPKENCATTAGSVQKLYNHIVNSHDPVTVLPTLEQGDQDTCGYCGDQLANRQGVYQHAKHTHPSAFSYQYRCDRCDTENIDPVDHITASHDIERVVSDKITHNCPHSECQYTYRPQSDSSRDKFGHRRQQKQRISDHYRETHLSASINCPNSQCEHSDVITAVREMQQHHLAVHNDGDTYWSQEQARLVPIQDTVEYLYVINKHAKKYGRLGDENYRKGKGATAKKNSVRKNALYAVKERVLEQIYEYADTIAIHYIDSDPFWYLKFGTYSFHSPVSSLAIPRTNISTRDHLDEFTSSEKKERADHPLKHSLMFFDEQMEITVNDYLEQKYISYGYSQYFAGWDYLGN